MHFSVKQLPGYIGLFLVAVIVLTAVFGDLIAPKNPNSQSLRDRMKPPATELSNGTKAYLGTDHLGRDILSRVIKGAQVSVSVAASAVILSGLIGTTLGLISGYYGGLFSATLMRIIDIQLGIPIILFGIAWITLFGAGLTSVVLVIVFWGWVKYARLAHVMVLSLKEREFVQASHALGASGKRILFRHITPNLLGPVIVLATLQLGEAVLLESTLSFLGVGVTPPTPTWGGMVADGRGYVDTAWWIVVFPGAAIALFVLGSNLLGDLVRDYLDPKSELGGPGARIGSGKKAISPPAQQQFGTAPATTQPLLKVEGLEVDFDTPRGTVSILKGVSFELKKGETLALVGESGSGKSITALSVLQLLPNNARISGQISFSGAQLLGMSAKEMRELRGNKIGIVFQEPMSSLNPLFTIGHQVEEAIRFHSTVQHDKARERTLELLRLVKLPEPERRFGNYPHELSGGQLQRVTIAMALANAPQILIADEPTTALDVTVQSQILGLLKELQKKLSLTVLLITHDFGVVRKMADRVCVMNKGEIVETGTTEQIFEHPQQQYTRALLAADPGEMRPPRTPSDTVMIEAKHVVVDFPIRAGVFGTKRFFRAVDGIDLTARKGQTIGVVGESGSGKSTLGRAVLGLVPSQGAIRYGGTDLRSLSPQDMRSLRQRLQIVFQDPFGSLSPRLRVAEIIGEGLRIHRRSKNRADSDRMIAEAMKEVGLNPDWRFRYPHEFSGGQRQRIAIARAMALRPDVIVLDEPTSALDRSVQLQIINLLNDLQEKHELTYIFISHDLGLIRAIADEVIVMKDGHVVESGTAQHIFENPNQDYTKALLKASFEIVT